ncbi:MAG: patatin-like phospholipase family protein [Microscillaceae bacterium]|nr:patatin-like phospholipase family protein [Microscillaceae bacterium]
MNKNIALVLSCGGARGIAHIGVIEELENQGFKISSIAGCSMGALVGGFYAAGKLDVYKEWLCSLTQKDVTKLIDLTLSSKGFIKGQRVFSEMKKLMADVNIEDLGIPYVAVATDVHDHEEFVFAEGSLYDAIRASVAIPSIIHPCFINGKEFVDGGIVNPIPINRAIRTENDSLVVVNVNSTVPLQSENEEIQEVKKKRNIRHYNYFMNKMLNFSLSNYASPRRSSIVGLIGKSMELMQTQIAELTLKSYPHDLLVNVSKQSGTLFEFHRAKDLIEEGKKAVKRSLQKQSWYENKMLPSQEETLYPLQTNKLAG